ncbi:hypothetical protein Tco_0692473 [Tanacetum coccineum]
MQKDIGEASKGENATAEILRGLDKLMKKKEDGGMYFIWVPLIGDVRTLNMDEAHASRLRAARDCQNSYVGNRRKQLGFEVGDKVILKVSSWKGVDKTLRFVEEPVEIFDREVKSLKRSRIPIVKVHWNLKRGHEDFMKTSIHTCSLSKLSMEVLVEVEYISFPADLCAP